MMAFAPTAIFLFLARALDGITAGNIPVASAVITDTTDEKNRAKGFGVIGASFGFGFIFGPAITAFTVRFGQSVPFIIAGIISVLAVIVTALLLPETNKHMGEVKKGKLFDFKSMAKALTDPNVGPTLLITLVYATAFSLLIYAFQPFAVKGLHLGVDTIALLFTLVGVAGLITQIVILPWVTKKWHIKDVFTNSLLIISFIFVLIFFSMNLYYYAIVTMIWALVNSLINPLIQTILSQETDARSQGAMQGLNASYMSIGQIVGPILGGAVASIGISYPFLLGGAFALACYFLSFRVLRKGVAKEDAF